MRAGRATSVVVETMVRLVEEGGSLPVRASFCYEQADPYAVEVVFHGEAYDEPVSWVFARELLVAGIDRPTGEGDVQLWPWSSPRGDFVALRLVVPEGEALFEVQRSVVARFLRRTCLVVRRGRESDHIDMDEVIGRLLRGPLKSGPQ
jgi:hypothetical protein